MLKERNRVAELYPCTWSFASRPGLGATKTHLICTSSRYRLSVAVLHSFKNMRMPPAPVKAVHWAVKVIQTPFNSNILPVYLLLTPPIADPSVIFSKPSACADILAHYPPSSVRMSWGPYPAESSGSTAAWQNQVVHSYNYGPSGALNSSCMLLF